MRTRMRLICVSATISKLWAHRLFWRNRPTRRECNRKRGPKIITRRKDRVKTGVTPLAAMLTVLLSTVVFLLWLGLVVIVTKVVMG